jgi:hypothetical protein
MLGISGVATAADAGHPSANFNALPISDQRLDRYERIPQEGWINGLSFRPCAKKAAQLTAAERYILAGLQPVADRQSYPESWILKIELFTWAYYGQKHAMPVKIDQDSLAAIGLKGDALNAAADWYKSPITGEFPRLDNPDFTPGGVYLRALTPAEARHLAQWNPQLAGLLTLRKIPGNAEAAPQDAFLMEPVFYYRFYGETGLLKEGISYLFAPRSTGAAN